MKPKFRIGDRVCVDIKSGCLPGRFIIIDIGTYTSIASKYGMHVEEQEQNHLCYVVRKMDMDASIVNRKLYEECYKVDADKNIYLDPEWLNEKLQGVLDEIQS